MRKNKKPNNTNLKSARHGSQKTARSKRLERKWYAILKTIILILVSAVLILAIINQLRHFYLHATGEGHKSNSKKEKQTIIQKNNSISISFSMFKLYFV